MHSREMDIVLNIKILILLSVANGAPVLAKRLLGVHLARPIDCGACFVDGRPWLGSSKTIRGLAASVIATSAVAPVIGIAWKLGLLAAVAAMIGDLTASFIKRRLGYASSEMALGLDQVPESLLPILALAPFLGLTLWDIAAVVLVFSAATPIVSRLLFRLGIRDRPY
jgi:CDP-2,3-bis-(O-geranylgeranyl)-sn-glycerol synthase